jgi:ABC-type nitrate/sulfonate/bicarbonate transport system ATPase subunit
MTAPDPGRVLLRTTSLGVRRGGNDVLRDVSLSLRAGEVLAVIGPNGAGKSTLLEAIGNLLPPATGAVERHGRVATALQSPDLARRSALANVELALAWWGVPRRERRRRATDALTAMGAAHLADRPAAAMSGGERRRVHLARAIATDADILLLDEPFAGLDAVSRGALLDDTSDAIRSDARAVVLVVHDRAEAWALADRLVVLMDGVVVAEGRPRDVLDAPPTAQVARFLGFTGELVDGDEVLLTRPSQVHADPAGDITATVTRLTPLEDGARVELQAAAGRLSAYVAVPGPVPGDSIRVRIDGGVRYPAVTLASPDPAE